jgi:hypothetical protein
MPVLFLAGLISAEYEYVPRNGLCSQAGCGEVTIFRNGMADHVPAAHDSMRSTGAQAEGWSLERCSLLSGGCVCNSHGPCRIPVSGSATVPDGDGLDPRHSDTSSTAAVEQPLLEISSRASAADGRVALPPAE